MLPAAHRLRDRGDFSAVLRNRRGGRAAGRLLVIHCATTSPTHPAEASRVGFIVSKAVGNAVVRNRTKRVLRHLFAARVSDLVGRDVVVRANPAAANATTAELAAELDRLLAKASARSGA